MIKSTNSISFRSMYSNANNAKGDKIAHRFYLLQQIKAKYFLKLNEEEGFNESIH